jgi:hypothetical protein
MGRAHQQCSPKLLRSHTTFQMPTEAHPAVTPSRGNLTHAWLRRSSLTLTSDRRRAGPHPLLSLLRGIKATAGQSFLPFSQLFLTLRYGAAAPLPPPSHRSTLPFGDSSRVANRRGCAVVLPQDSPISGPLLHHPLRITRVTPTRHR